LETVWKLSALEREKIPLKQQSEDQYSYLQNRTRHTQRTAKPENEYLNAVIL